MPSISNELKQTLGDGAKILVTGAAGFIGSRLVQKLIAKGYHVIALDNLSVGLPLPAEGLHLTPVQADVRNVEYMARIFGQYRPDAIIHLAALHHIPTCEAKPHLALDINVIGTQVLLDLAQQHACENIIIASSGAVYDWHDGPLAEQSANLKARDIYATTKLTNEYQASTWTDRSGLRAHVARIFNVIGLNDPNAHLIPDIVKQLKNADQKCKIRLGNLTPRRDYIYVDDVARGLCAMLESMPGAALTETYNLCTGNEISVSDLVLQLGDAAGVTVELEQDPARMRKVDRPSQLGDPAKAAGKLNWTAERPFKDVLAEIISGHQEIPSLAATA